MRSSSVIHICFCFCCCCCWGCWELGGFDKSDAFLAHFTDSLDEMLILTGVSLELWLLDSGCPIGQLGNFCKWLLVVVGWVKAESSSSSQFKKTKRSSCRRTTLSNAPCWSRPRPRPAWALPHGDLLFTTLKPLSFSTNICHRPDFRGFLAPTPLVLSSTSTKSETKRNESNGSHWVTGRRTG